MDEYHSLLAQCRERGLKSGGSEAMLRERLGLPPPKDRAAPPRVLAVRLRASAVPPDPLPAYGTASSLFAGVVWSRSSHVWVAYYYLLDREKKRQHNVGHFATEQLAAGAPRPDRPPAPPSVQHDRRAGPRDGPHSAAREKVPRGAGREAARE